MTMDGGTAPGGDAPDEIIDRLLDALAAGNWAMVERMAASCRELDLAAAAAAAAAAQRALAVRSSPPVRAQHVRALTDEAARLSGTAPSPVGAAAPPASEPAPSAASKPRRGWGWPRRVAVTLAAVVAIGAAGLTATAALAANAQPGQALYGTKLALENVQADVQLNPAKRVSLRVRFAEERLDELATLLAHGKIDRGGQAAGNLAAQERKITAALVKLAAEGKAPPSLVRSLELDLVRHYAKLRAEASSICPRRPQPAPCRELGTALSNAQRAVRRLGQLPGGIPNRPRLGAANPSRQVP
ncbi:MAG TPA: DUF5667 domain-containing protein [Actinomycetota bacterium]|nr:DUF5667 domain-containing protein [Actinomycetota bacterium]